MDWTAKRDGVLTALATRPLIMGILNATPDSFSDGGQHDGPRAALSHAKGMVADGCDILDVGGESTRPGATPVELAEELSRILPVVEALPQTHNGESTQKYQSH